MAFTSHFFKFPLFSSRFDRENSSPEKISVSQKDASVVKEETLEELLRCQKSMNNNMVYICDLDENNKLKCRWMKVLS